MGGPGSGRRPSGGRKPLGKNYKSKKFVKGKSKTSRELYNYRGAAHGRMIDRGRGTGDKR